MSSPLLWYSPTGYEVGTVAISSDGNYIISGSQSSDKNLIAFYHRNSSVPLWVKDDLNGVNSVDISSNGSYMVAGTGHGPEMDTTVYLFEKDSPTPLWSYQLDNIVFCVAISSDGNILQLVQKMINYLTLQVKIINFFYVVFSRKLNNNFSEKRSLFLCFLLWNKTT